MKKRVSRQMLAGWSCIVLSAVVMLFVAYGIWADPGPVGLPGLWLEPWFLITLADLYVGIFVAIGLLWASSGATREKVVWTLFFIVGGHPAFALWIGLRLVRGNPLHYSVSI